MPVKRKSSYSYGARKRSRMSGFRRPRGRYGKTFRRKGSRFPTYKFHRYITTLGSYAASTNLDTAALPFTWYPYNNAGTVSSYPFSFAFTFNDVGNLAEFTSLFDRYMITGVAIKFQLINNPDVPVVQSAVAAVPSVQTYPRLWYAPDYDDSNLTTLAMLKEYQNVKSFVLEPNKIKTIFVRAPRTSQAVSQVGGPVPAGVNKPMWLDCGFPNVPHYGLKTCLDFGSAYPGKDTFAFRVKWEAVYYFRCKDVV